jgi:hypothetical protein
MWLAVYAALAIGNRGILPVSGPAYFGIVAFNSITVTLPFALDRRGTQDGQPGLDTDLLDGIRRCRVPAIAPFACGDLGVRCLYTVWLSTLDASGRIRRHLGHHLPDCLVRIVRSISSRRAK